MARRDPHRSVARIRAALLALTTLATGVAAQVQWTPAADLENRTGHAIAADPAGGGVLLFGGHGTASSTWLDDAWRWDGATWTRLDVGATAPPPRAYHALAADPVRGRVVLFGGGDAAAGMDDTWEWDGARWSLRSPVGRPTPRERHAMIFDAGRGRVVLYGGGYRPTPGSGRLNPTDGTWEWDGTRWSQRPTIGSPGPRYGHAMAYDPVRRRIVLFGGMGPAYRGDTWEFDGTTWWQCTPAHSPAARHAHGMVYDPIRQRVLLAGGRDARLQYLDDLWAWDGTDWTAVPTPQPLPARAYHALAWESSAGVVLAFGGLCTLGRRSDTWRWDGSTWSLARAGFAPPESPALTAWDPVRRRVLVFVGSTDVLEPTEQWEWDGRTGRPFALPTLPPARISGAIATDTGRGRIVVFGGATRAGLSAETLEWDGTAWSAPAPTSADVPPARSGHALAYDGARARIVLFGGRPWNGPAFDDTWTWDGASWVQQHAAVSPAGRSAHAMTFDAARGRVVLFGGMADGLGYASDTWEWDGGAWKEALPPTRPAGRSGHALTYDAARRRAVLFGGFSFSTTGNTWFAGSWEWDGVDWTRRSPATAPGARQFHALVYDPDRAVGVLFGGDKESGGPASDTWEYGPVDPARVDDLGPGCPGSAGVPELVAGTGAGPWLDADFGVELRSLPQAGAALLMLGTSSRSLPPFTLPLDLGPVGMPGCWLRVRAEVFDPLAVAGDRGRWSVRVPADRGLLGAELHAQALVVDPPANPLGATLSNALTAVVGAK